MAEKISSHPPDYEISGEIPLSENTLAVWQDTVDLMANMPGVATALIVCRDTQGEIVIRVCSRNPENIYREGQKTAFGSDLCAVGSATVIRTAEEFFLPNVPEDPKSVQGRKTDPGTPSYLGVPLTWPSGQVFGALCILSDRKNHFSESSRKFLKLSQYTVQLGLQRASDQLLRCRQEKEMERLRSDLKRAQDDIEQRVQERTEELSKANEALRESEARFRTLMDHAPEAVTVLDLDTMVFLDANNKAEELFGLCREDILKIGPDQLSPLVQPDGTLSSELARIQTLKAATEGVNIFEWVHTNKMGEEILCEVRLARLPSSGRNLFRASVIDITKPKKAELALIQSENKYRTIFDNISEGLAFVDINGRFLDVNPAYCQMLGYDQNEMMGLHLSDIIHPDWQPISASFLSLVHNSETIKREIVHVHKKGHLIHTEVQGRAFRFKGEDCLLGAIRDITERKRAEAALKESEERVRLLLDSTAEAIYGLDLDGKCTFCNPSTLRLLGYRDQSDLLGKNMHELIHHTHPNGDSYPAQECRACQSFRRNEGSHVKDEVFWRSDGTCFPVEYRSFPIYKKGQLLGAVVTFLDISESKQAEQALAKSESQFRSIFENSAMGIILLDLEGRLVSCNPAFCTMTGYTEAELTSIRFKDFTFPEDIPLSLREFEDLLAGKNDYYQVEKRYTTKSGDIIWARLTVSRVRAAEALTDFVLAMAEDVTDQRKAEHALLQSEERYRTIFNHISDGLSVHDFEGRFLEVNPADCEMHGYTKEEMMALTVPEMVHPSNHDVFNEYKSSIEKTGFYVGEVVQYRKDGSLINVEVKGTTIYLENKQYLLAIVRDITERKRTEEELRLYREHLEDLVEERTLELAGSKEQAEAANRAKSVFLANMSHELRTPLNTILGFSQLMQHDPALTHTAREKLDYINRSGEHLLGLINDVLEVSKIEAGHIALNETTFDFYLLLEDIEGIFDMRAAQNGVQFKVEKPDDLPRFLVGDQVKLRQVLINLLGNAMKFTEEGCVTLRVSSIAVPSAGIGKEDREPLELLLEVEDSGVGIAPNEMTKLFQPFEQTLSGRTKGGTGLGLAISKEYASLMGGSITARSRQGKGSLFALTCRIGEGRKELIDQAEEGRRVVGLTPNSGSKSILVVDDKEESRRFVSELLSLVGFETREATNGEDALAVFDAMKPDLVLMDMGMPVMDGYEATRRLKSTAAGQRTSVIALTACALEDDRDKVLASGADELIRKPFRQSELFNAMGRLLGVEYRYAEIKVAGPEERRRLTPGDLEELPEELREALRQALITLNVKAIRTAIDRVSAHNRGAGEAMSQLERNYQFERLLELVQTKGLL